MRATLSNRFGIPGVIATIALVFAMTGGAFAAKYLITSTKQISPSVLKKLKGKKGAKGATGPAGPAGAQGLAGASGAKGDTGAEGKKGEQGIPGEDGEDGEGVVVTEVPEEEVECDERGGAIVEEEDGSPQVEVCNGEKGEKGPPGDPWTAGGTLPPGATLTGTWTFNGAGNGEQYVPISFPIPLAFDLGLSRVHQVAQIPSGTCTGTDDAPKAPPGELCVYTTEVGAPATPAGIWKTDFGAEGAHKSGALLWYTGTTAASYGYGTWAVTGCGTSPPLPEGDPNKCP